jgi:general stress protein CsbA
MENIEFEKIWKSYDQKIENLITINKELAIDLTRQKLNRQINRLYLPKWTGIAIGVPYTILLISITVIASIAKAYFVAIGFWVISLIMVALLIHYFYHLYLISEVKSSEDIISTQEQLSKLKISSFNSINLAVFQLPFWSICWMSVDAFKASPFLYGGINLLVFLGLAYIAYWLYNQLSYKNEKSKVRDFFLSGREWEPIIKSSEILEQIEEYR